MAAAGKRHPLLIYGRLYRTWRAPALLISIGCALLWWMSSPALDSPVVEPALLAAASMALVLFLYSLAGPRLSYVQCLPTHLRVCTPLYRMAISYSRIRTTRPVLFQSQAAATRRRWMAKPYSGMTAIAIDLYGYPVSLRWLRQWLNEFVLPADVVGMLLLTPDWMALSRDIERCRGEWKDRTRTAARTQAAPSMTPRKP